MSELDDRLDALEQQVAAPIKVQDLPMGALHRSLEQQWLPEAGVLLQKGSVPTALRADIQTKTVTMAVGVGAHTLNTAGSTGIILVDFIPATHWTFTWFPRKVDVVFNNTGVSQSVTFSYIVL